MLALTAAISPFRRQIDTLWERIIYEGHKNTWAIVFIDLDVGQASITELGSFNVFWSDVVETFREFAIRESPLLSCSVPQCFRFKEGHRFNNAPLYLYGIEVTDNQLMKFGRGEDTNCSHLHV